MTETAAPSSSAEKLNVARATKRYGDFVALHPTDLVVEPGEFVTLLGPSGSGKTTLLMIIAGLLQPDGGRILIDGHNATYAPPWERGIGMVFQNYALFPHLSVFENIAFPLRMRRVAEADIRRAVTKALDTVQLPHVADRLPRALSGGQQQRIALARCIVFEPSLILMDEPLGALDKKLRDQLQIEIKHLHSKLGTTIIYVTHDQQEALTMSDRICLMNGGRIEQLGTPEDLYFRPRSWFAADFLGESNFLKVRVESTDGGSATVSVAGQPAARLIVPAAGHSAGGQASLMIRPESLRVSREAPRSGNFLRARLLESIFVGGITRRYVALDGGGSLFALELTAPESDPMDGGDQVFVSWDSNRGVLLSASETKP